MSVIYLTPKRFRTLGTGIDLTGKSDADLLASLTVASAMANTFCSAPTDHDFRGGAVASEQHRWDMGNQWKIGNNRIYPFHRPLKTVDQLQIDITNEQRVTLPDTSLYSNKVEGWVEPVAMALTTVGLFGWTILPGYGLREPVAKVDYSYGWSFGVINEELSLYATYSGGADLQAQSQFWDESVTPVIKQNGTPMGSGYTIDPVEGMVSITGYSSSNKYTATYTHTLPLAIARATGMIMTDVIGQASIAGSGLLGLSSLRVEEIEIHQSGRGAGGLGGIGLYNAPVNGAAAMLLTPYKYASWG